MDAQLIDNQGNGGAVSEVQGRDSEDEKIEIHLPGSKHKKKAGTGKRSEGPVAFNSELFPAPPPSSGSRKAHQEAAAAGQVGHGTPARPPPARPCQGPSRPPPPTSQSHSSSSPANTSASSTAAKTASSSASRWEQFDEDEGDDEESGSAVSSEQEGEEEDEADGSKTTG